ncbi:MFS transporter [Bacillus pumilus]|uniref:Permease n=1 Tax=Bacillus pumilus (strain SAFR-032) TaxID=315750 RepID=A8FFJ7_BACP2|nr:MFS transporter [Bacillus pumilus]ABV63014.1 permease [Bacillus pumilus SAFR-032]MBC3644441.1 MFS transporter [Bacillus pumilus]MBC3648044.1 MFS transporter [Bacillus pumilus]MBC3651347.1 MFS transporter [Bacillus pumilus]MBC3655175.1 MFS transporter [Bacillus pumilus]
MKKHWRDMSLLLGAIGIANIGEWIYMIALHLLIFQETGSVLAVTAVYMLRPVASLLTNSWSGSLIDRLNQRKVMISLDISRAILIACIPFAIFSGYLLTLYVIVFLIQMAQAMFHPASMVYMTGLIPADNRKRFNAIRSLLQSGGFLLGPAVAGLLFLIGTPVFSIYINAICLLVSALFTMCLPNLLKQDANQKGFTLSMLKEDAKLVLRFSLTSRQIMTVYLLFSAAITVLPTAIDSLETAFAKEVLLLTDTQYGLLVSIAGAGIIAGAGLNSVIVEKLTVSIMLGVGSLFVACGYLIYAFSSTLFAAAVGFFILAFFLAFANTGFMTFYQTNIPVEVMGRVASFYALVEAILTIMMTGFSGGLAHVLSIRTSVVIGSLCMLLVCLLLCFVIFRPLTGKKIVHPT